MNCFEARQEFSAFWRRALSAERRGALVEHLGRCGRCDRAFRFHALSAPVIELEPAAERAGNYAARRAAAPAREREMPRGARRWMPMCAAVAVFAASALAAYLSVAAPIDELGDDLGDRDLVTEWFVPDAAPVEDDLG